MATIRDLFPFGDLDDSVVAAAKERFPIVPFDDLGAGFALGKAMVDILDTMAGSVGEFGVSPARWRLLVALIVQTGPEGATIGELAAHLGVREPTVTATVDRLEQEGLVSRTRDASDGRVVRVTPTAEGLQTVSTAIPTVAARLSAFVTAMGGPAEVRAVADRIATARQQLEAQT